MWCWKTRKRFPPKSFLHYCLLARISYCGLRGQANGSKMFYSGFRTSISCGFWFVEFGAGAFWLGRNCGLRRWWVFLFWSCKFLCFMWKVFCLSLLKWLFLWWCLLWWLGLGLKVFGVRITLWHWRSFCGRNFRCFWLLASIIIRLFLRLQQLVQQQRRLLRQP